MTIAARWPPPASGGDGPVPGAGRSHEVIRYAVVDVETTGLDPAITRVLECAVVELGPDGDVLAEWVSLVSVPGEGELGASWLHGITRAMLAGAPSFADIAGEISGRLAGRVLIGHVLDFDLAHLAAEFARCGLRFPALRGAGICTRDLARAGLPPGSRSLIACCRALGVSCPAAHTALGDARATAAVFRAFLQRGAVPDPAKVAARAARLPWPEAVPGPSRAVPRPDSRRRS